MFETHPSRRSRSARTHTRQSLVASSGGRHEVTFREFEFIGPDDNRVLDMFQRQMPT